MTRKPRTVDTRTPVQIREQYEIERELAARLRRASRDERRVLYSELYDELYRRVPHHPQLSRKASPEDLQRSVEEQMRLLGSYLHADTTFLEVGPGDCALAVAVAQHVERVHAVDVSSEISRNIDLPVNASLILSDGSSVPVSSGSVHVAYSHQLMEHLHPDDAMNQLANIHRALAPGGVYLCCTPNRLSGPHDVSQHFDQVATGFHLKEYTYRDLAALFKKVGFTRLRGVIRIKGRYLVLPLWFLDACESLLLGMPFRLRRAVARRLPYRFLLGICMVGSKEP